MSARKKILLLLCLYLSNFANSNCPEKLTRISRGEAKIAALASDHVRYHQAQSEFITAGSTVAKWDPDLRTMIYHTGSTPDKNGEMPLVDPNSKGVVIYFHGSGTEKASGRNFAAKLNEIRTGGLSGIGIDLPFHKDNKGDKRQFELDYFMNWLHKFISEVKESGKPIYLMGHSFGPEVAQEYASRYPNDVKGILLVSPAPSHPALDWTYQNITEPGMKYMPGGTDVGENDAGGRWAGSIGSQSTWPKNGISPKVKVKVLLGETDEWWPGNTYLPEKLGVQQKYNMKEPLDYLMSHYPHGELNLVPDVGHYIFDKKAPNGKNLITESLFDLAEIPEGERYKPVVKSAREELATLHKVHPGFREWIGNRYQRAIGDERRAAEEMKGWENVRSRAWKLQLEQMQESHPDFAKAREVSIKYSLSKFPEAQKDIGSFYNTVVNSQLQGDFTLYLKAKKSGEVFRPGPDPMRPADPKLDPKLTTPGKMTAYQHLISAEKIAEFAKTNGEDVTLEDVPGSDKIKKLTYSLKGKQESRFALSNYSEQQLKNLLYEATYKAWENAKFTVPSGKWTVEVDGMKIEGQWSDNVLIRFAILGPADAIK